MVGTGGSQVNRISRELRGEAVTLRGGPIGAAVIRVIFKHKLLTNNDNYKYYIAVGTTPYCISLKTLTSNNAFISFTMKISDL